MSIPTLAGATQLRQAETRLGVRFPAAFRDAVLAQRKPKSGSRYILLPLNEVNTTDWWGVPGDGVVVARSVAGGYVVLMFACKDESTPRSLNDSPLLWEPEDEDEDEDEDDKCEVADLRVIGDSFDDVIDPAHFEKSRLCPHCGSDSLGSICTVCGRRRGDPPATDPDRDVANAMVDALVQSGELVTRSARSTERIIYATAQILHDLDDDAVAAAETIRMWEDAAEVEEIFIEPEELVKRFLSARWRQG